MSDGVRLSAKIWMPIDIKSQPVPAILEIIPYRKRDSYALRDHANHAWLAAHGYACIRPDMRGHGDSEGIMLDEYSKREQQDTIEVINWLARQPWCTGKVGMMGLSWGGIASLQAAVKQPPALKAIIPVGLQLIGIMMTPVTLLEDIQDKASVGVVLWLVTAYVHQIRR